MKTSKLTTLCAALLVAGLSGCDAGDDDVAASPDLVPPAATEPAADTTTGTEADAAMFTVATGDDGGTYLTDGAGNAVYMLEGDPEGDACVGDCLETWPPVLVADVQPGVDAAAGLDPALIGTMQRPDGTMQVTYNGFPLYRYAADTGANRMAGHGIEDQWGHWYLLTPAGEEFAMIGTAADAGTTADAEAQVDTTEDADASTDDDTTGDDY